MSHLICFLGRNGSGKTYQSNQLVKKGYTKISLADPVRELAWRTLNWRPENEIWYQEFKNDFITLIRNEMYGEPWADFGTGRQYLQNLAEGCKEMFGDDFWVKQWDKKVKQNLGEYEIEEYEGQAIGMHYPDGKIVTDDIRFPIEIESAHKLGATFIWCDYKNGEYEPNDHVSEALANKILASGKFKDGEEISYEQLKTFIN